jgi:hypothetical protein
MSQDGLGITLDSASLGHFEDTIVLHSFGSNASGFDGALPDAFLVLRGDVVGVAAVPEPSTYLLLLVGLLLVFHVRRRGRDRIAS